MFKSRSLTPKEMRERKKYSPRKIWEEMVLTFMLDPIGQ